MYMYLACSAYFSHIVNITCHVVILERTSMATHCTCSNVLHVLCQIMFEETYAYGSTNNDRCMCATCL